MFYCIKADFKKSEKQTNKQTNMLFEPKLFNFF